MPSGLLREVVAVPLEEVVAVDPEPARGLGVTPGFELLLGASRMAQGVYVDGVYSPGRPEFVRAAPVDALAEVILLAECEDGRMGDDFHGVLRAEELSGEGPRHAHAEVVDGQVNFVRGRQIAHC